MDERGLKGRDDRDDVLSSPTHVAPVEHRDPDQAGVQARMTVILHELRSPIAVTAMAAETLQGVLQRSGDDGSADAEVIAELSATIERNSRLAARLLDRLGLARDIEQGAVELSPRVLDLVRLTEDTVSDLTSLSLDGHTVTVQRHDEVRVVADATAISEVLFNLLGNAVKYSERGAAIDVVVESDEAWARVVVRNHGTGVAPDDVERIFAPYEQLDRRNSGMGLGLYLSRGIARAHGGDLTVQPATRQGSEFVLTLPVTPSAPRPSGATAASA